MEHFAKCQVEKVKAKKYIADRVAFSGWTKPTRIFPVRRQGTSQTSYDSTRTGTRKIAGTFKAECMASGNRSAGTEELS